MSPSPASEFVVASKAHHFALKGRWYLFDIASLAVAAAEATDGALLDLARDGVSRAHLATRAISLGLSPADAEARIAALVAAGFLHAPEQAEKIAERGEHAGYATFMINVAQRCNLTCPYCYVHEGTFDYEQKPIP